MYNKILMFLSLVWRQYEGERMDIKTAWEIADIASSVLIKVKKYIKQCNHVYCNKDKMMVCLYVIIESRGKIFKW